MQKKGQLKISFGMIFSILLIIIFLALAIYGIIKFLDLKDEILITDFFEHFGKDVDSVWQSAGNAKKAVSYNLPSKVEEVCFSTRHTENVELIVKREHYGESYDHLSADICIEVIDGKVKFYLTKKYGEQKVKVEKIIE